MALGETPVSSVGLKNKPALRHRHLRLITRRALGNAGLHQRRNAVVLHLIDDRANIDSLIQRRANAQRLHARADLFVEALGDALLHQQPRARAAHLPLVEPDAVDKAFHSGIKIGVVEDNERALAAEFERQFLTGIRRDLADDAANFGGTGECNLVDPRMLNDGRAGSTVAVDDVQHALGQPNLVRNLGEGQRGERRVLRWLNHDSASRRQRRRYLPRKHQQRKIPRNDLPHHARRRIARELFIAQLRPSRMVIEMPRHERNIDVARLANRLAVVERLQHSKPPRVLLHLPRQRIEIPRPLMPRQRLPTGQRRPRRLHRAIDLRRIGASTVASTSPVAGFFTANAPRPRLQRPNP